jgi:LPS sulfotransferase NodH
MADMEAAAPQTDLPGTGPETGLETGLAAMLDPIERGQLAESMAWFRARLVPGGRFRSRLKPDEDPRLLLICMTPRSGSTALSGLMLATGALGRGGERLNRHSGFLSRVIAATPPRSLRHLLEMVIRSSRSANGVAQIKADLPQLLPFLADPACFDLLRRAGIVYLTRENVLAQAISRYRGIQTGVWHAAAKGQADPAADPGTDRGPDRGTDVPFDHAAIAGQIDRIAGMMACYERLFARLGLQPLRITYEQIAADPGAVLGRIAALAGVDPALAGQAASLDDGGFRRVSGRNNDELRDRFLAENRRHLVAGG